MESSSPMTSNAGVLARPSRAPILTKSAPSGRMETATFDGEYVKKLIAGDPATESHFVAYFNQMLLLKLRGRIRSRELIDDARQETFLRVLRVLRSKGIDNPERLGAFVNGVCENVLFENFRAEARYCEIAEEGQAMIDARITADAAFVNGERKKQIAAVLKELSPKDAELLRALFLEELTKDEICGRYNCTRDYLRVLLHRARLKFRDLYTEAYVR